MRVRRTSLALAAAASVAVSLGSAAPSLAGPPGSWTVISGPGISSIDEPGMHRTADGTLHVAIREDANNQESIAVANISAAGALVGRSVAVPGWAGVTADPDIVGSPSGGMRLVFGGLRTTSTGDAYSEGYVYETDSDASGAAWTLGSNTAPVITSPNGAASYGTGVTTLADGTLVAAYPINSTITYQVGNAAPQSFDVPHCCAYDLTLVNDGGTVYAAWYGNGATPDSDGVFVRTLYPTLGPVLTAPQSSSGTASLPTGQAVAMVARAGGGVYLAYNVGYPTTKAVGLWRVGTPKATLVKDSKAAGQVAMSAGPAGRLWLAFDDADDNVRVVHTNTTASTLGAVQVVKTPKGSTVYDLGIEGSTGRGDVVFNNGTAMLHTQVRYGLSVKAKPGKLKAGKAGSITFTVTDAGDPVKGAKVKAKGHTCKTDKHGKCSISFPGLPGRKFEALAKANGYAAGSVEIKVKR